MSDVTERIIDPCPSCGWRTLFVGSGGYLICSSLDCKEPGVGRAIENLKAENKKQAERELALKQYLVAVEDAWLTLRKDGESREDVRAFNRAKFGVDFILGRRSEEP